MHNMQVQFIRKNLLQFCTLHDNEYWIIVDLYGIAQLQGVGKSCDISKLKKGKYSLKTREGNFEILKE